MAENGEKKMRLVFYGLHCSLLGYGEKKNTGDNAQSTTYFDWKTGITLCIKSASIPLISIHIPD